MEPRKYRTRVVSYYSERGEGAHNINQILDDALTGCFFILILGSHNDEFMAVIQNVKVYDLNCPLVDSSVRSSTHSRSSVCNVVINLHTGLEVKEKSVRIAAVFFQGGEGKVVVRELAYLPMSGDVTQHLPDSNVLCLHADGRHLAR